ncbi:MAG: acetyl-CoA acetyltransferase [Candidatus Lindowbacteria bacterium]|nr:acetyl-CoA acetyltransferase [Candidatus Lindowbacteria bacterium]
MATGIKDKVAIIGMGCTRFGERWDVGSEELMVEAFQECIQDAGIEKKDIQAAWLGTCMDEVNVGKSALPLSLSLRLDKIACTRVENFCASGTESLRGAVYAVASGAYDICLAMGAEKLKDTGYGGLPAGGSSSGTLNWLWLPAITAPGSFAQLASAYAAKYKVSDDDLKLALAHVSAKSHANGALNPKAHLRKAVTVELGFNSWDGDHFVTTSKASLKAYEEAGVKDPRKEISMMEVHDCFSITEFVTMEDLHISPRGGALKDVMDGFYNLDGGVPCQVDGGLKCFGHPIGASGLRMVYEMYLQLHGRADKRQLKDPKIGLTHNLGGFPFMNVCSIAIVGKYGV